MAIDPSIAESQADARLSELVDELAARLQSGDSEDADDFIRAHAEHADALRRLLPTARALAELGQASSGNGASKPWNRHTSPFADGAPTMTLGDFRIVREIGRGGMGVVYEAEQISLGRRVALKVLPFAAALDDRHLQRFKNEAQAAAHLHHTNIVPVFAVGAERGVHYYAMQYIEGQNLASLIDELVRMSGAPGEANGAAGRRADGSSAASGLARDFVSGTFCPARVQESSTDPPPADATRAENSAATNISSQRGDEYMRTVADLGRQAAEALQYAHGLGIVHRDVKPANLLLDARGNVWITDFGLAQVVGDAQLTTTGDVVGTMRYMSPEQAFGRRLEIDHRTDIYALGITLYELATLHRAFAGNDRQALLGQIGNEEPIPPRRHNPAIPGELETIILKSISKSPIERYGSAGAMAEDLRRFLHDEPIRARRPTYVQRLRKWSRRHRSLVWTLAASAALLFAVIAGAVGWVARDRNLRQIELEGQVRDLARQAENLLDPPRWEEAAALVEQAESLADKHGVDGAMRKAIAEVDADLKLLTRLEVVRMQRADGSGEWEQTGFLDVSRADGEYRQALADYGLDLFRLTIDEIDRRVTRLAVRRYLADALDDWALVRFAKSKSDPSHGRHLLEVARRLDADALRGRVRTAVVQQDRKALLAIADESKQSLPAKTALLLANALVQSGEWQPALRVLQSAQRRYPDDFWLNYMTAWHGMHRLRLDEEMLRYATAAVALRPSSAAAHHLLGYVLEESERPEEAEVACRRALALDPDYAPALQTLSRALRSTKRYEEALVIIDRAIQAKPDSQWFHQRRGEILLDLNRVDAAIATFQKLIAEDEDEKESRAWWKLGQCYAAKKQWEDAVAAYRMALARGENAGGPNDDLSNALIKLGRFDEAEEARREALRAWPEDPQRYGRLANLLAARGKWAQAWKVLGDAANVWLDAGAYYMVRGDSRRRRMPEAAINDWRKALKSRPHDYAVRAKLGAALRELGRLDEAIVELRRAAELNSRDYWYHVNLGDALLEANRPQEALVAFEAAFKVNRLGRTARVRIGETLCRTGRPDEGMELIRRVIGADRSYEPAKKALAEELNRRSLSAACSQKAYAGELQAALEQSREATRLAPVDSHLWRTKALAHYRLGNWDSALTAAGQATTVKPVAPLDDLLTAVILARRGDVEEARKHFEAVTATSSESGAEAPLLSFLWQEADAIFRAAPPGTVEK
jgi:serine/threonine protein kinase/Flp pilus assembly protein TadD